MDISLINPPEKLRVWAGIPKAHAHGVYCFPPLGLMYIQAAIEKRSHYQAEIIDPVVGDLDYPDFEQMLKELVDKEAGGDPGALQQPMVAFQFPGPPPQPPQMLQRPLPFPGPLT